MIKVDFASNQIAFWSTVYEKKIVDTQGYALELEKNKINLTNVRLEIAKSKEDNPDLVSKLEEAYLNYYEANMLYINNSNSNAWHLTLIEIINSVPISNNTFIKSLADLVIQGLNGEMQVLRQSIIVNNKKNFLDETQFKDIRRRAEDIEANLTDIYKVMRTGKNIDDKIDNLNFTDLTKFSPLEILNMLYGLHMYVNLANVSKSK